MHERKKLRSNKMSFMFERNNLFYLWTHYDLRSNVWSFTFERKIRFCTSRYTLTRMHSDSLCFVQLTHAATRGKPAHECAVPALARLLVVDLYIVNANLRIDPALPALSSQVRLSSSPALPRIILLTLVTLCTCRYTLLVCVNIWKHISWRGIFACMPQLHERHRSKNDYDGWRCETCVQALNACLTSQMKKDVVSVVFSVWRLLLIKISLHLFFFFRQHTQFNG